VRIGVAADDVLIRGKSATMTESNNIPVGIDSSDRVSLAEAAEVEGLPASSQDSILNAAHVFEAQLEQMSAWKHQLAQQMEIMRRDGIKLLERQKSLAVERKRLSEEREVLIADRQHVEKLHREVSDETKRLREKEAEIEQSRAVLQKLDGERQRWEREIAAAEEAAGQLERRRAETEAELAEAGVRLREIETLSAQRGALEAEIAASRGVLAEIETQRATAEALRHDLAQKEAELEARQRTLIEQESRHLAEDVQLKTTLEQVEQQRLQLVEAQRALLQETHANAEQQQERETSLNARLAALTEREQKVAAESAALSSQGEQLLARQRTLDEAKAALEAQQQQLAATERRLAEQKITVNAELEGRVASAEKARKQAEEDRQALLKQRQQLEAKLDDMEAELTTQLDMLAKQTKRLTERRAELEARALEQEKEFETRLARETETLRDELARTHQTYEQRAALLQQQIDRNQTGTSAWAAKEAQLEKDLAAAAQQLTKAREELAQLTTALTDATREKAETAQRFAEEIARHEQETIAWQRELQSAREAAQAAAASNQSVSADQVLQAELEQTRSKLEAAESRQQALEQQLAGAGSAGQLQLDALSQQVDMLDRQRNDLAAQLFALQDTLRRQTDEALLAKNSLEGELLTLRRRHAALEAERNQWQSQPPTVDPSTHAQQSAELEQVQASLAAHHDRLLRQARTLRAYRRQVRETKSTLETSREEIAQQREQLRSRKENLEQVKRLLEKQEMVMARKLADHNALKTVAAVGIFVIMVLGSVFIGVYKFVNPVYRSEAVVQLAPPASIAGAEQQAWMAKQVDFFRTDDLTFTAWKMLRAPDEHYGMHDVREEWLASLSKNLSVQLDPASKTVAIRYTGPNPDGVAQVCNALADAYATPTARETTSEQNRGYGVGSTVLAKAAAPIYPAEDSRLMLSLSVVAIVLFLSLIMVIVFRHYVARQLREIDQMADEQDLDDIRTEMPQTETA
jgi:chromosome segregation ATPase